MENEFVCQYCGRICKTNYGKTFHQDRCKENPFRIEYHVERKKVQCPLCGTLISSSQLKKHLGAHERGNWDKRQKYRSVTHGGLNCIYCDKLCKNKNSLAQHEIRCKSNPDRISCIGSLKGIQVMSGWNRGKTKETDPRIAKSVQTFKEHLAQGQFKPSFLGRAVSDETKQKIRDSIHQEQLQRGNRAKWGTYKGIHCDSSWELAFLVYHLDNGLFIRRSIYKFPYINTKGEQHYYYPDFDTEFNTVEIKGFMSEDAKLKISAVPEDIPFKLILSKDIQQYLQYAKRMYGENFYDVLYDQDKPNYKNWKELKNKTNN